MQFNIYGVIEELERPVEQNTIVCPYPLVMYLNSARKIIIGLYESC